MSKHWNPRVVEGGRSAKRPRGRPSGPRNARSPRGPYRGRRRGGLAETVFAVSLGLFLAVAYGTYSGGALSRAEAGSPAAVYVIDGDTFDHGGVRIRIADIDTPELRGECAYERRLARQAALRLDALLDEGPFELRPAPDGRDEDVYGRKLRIVTRGGASLGGVLVEEGLARRWTGRREPWC